MKDEFFTQVLLDDVLSILFRWKIVSKMIWYHWRKFESFFVMHIEQFLMSLHSVSFLFGVQQNMTKMSRCLLFLINILRELRRNHKYYLFEFTYNEMSMPTDCFAWFLTTEINNIYFLYIAILFSYFFFSILTRNFASLGSLSWQLLVIGKYKFHSLKSKTELELISLMLFFFLLVDYSRALARNKQLFFISAVNCREWRKRTTGERFIFSPRGDTIMQDEIASTFSLSV